MTRLHHAAAVQGADRKQIERSDHEAAPAADEEGVDEGGAPAGCARAQHRLGDAPEQQAALEQQRRHRQQVLLQQHRSLSGTRASTSLLDAMILSLAAAGHHRVRRICDEPGRQEVTQTGSATTKKSLLQKQRVDDKATVGMQGKVGRTLGMLLEKERPRMNRTVDASPAAAGPDTARSKRSARLRTRLRILDSAPNEPIWPLGTNSAGPSLICRQGECGSTPENCQWSQKRLVKAFVINISGFFNILWYAPYATHQPMNQPASVIYD